MLLVYPGPFDQVEIPAANVVAKQGVPVDVPDALADSLIEQGWKPAKSRKDSD